MSHVPTLFIVQQVPKEEASLLLHLYHPLAVSFSINTRSMSVPRLKVPATQLQARMGAWQPWDK